MQLRYGCSAAKTSPASTEISTPPVDSLAPPPSVIDKGTYVEMVDEACLHVSVRGTSVATSVKTRVLPTLESEWFERPIEVGSGVLPTSSGLFFTHSFNPANFPLLWTQKFTGYSAARFTSVYTVVFSSTPFHAGLVRASWEPIGPAPRAKYDRSSTVTSFTLPGAMIDLQDYTSVCLSAPWSSNVPYARIKGFNNFETSPGTFRLHQVVPVISPTGTEAPSYSVFLHLEDLELIGPYPTLWSNAQPQSGIVDTVSSAVVSGRKRTQQFIRSKTTAGKVAAVKGIVEDLRSSKAISTTLGMGATVATALGAVPLLSTVAAPVGWMLRTASNVAARWGFSKPTPNAPLTRIYHMPDAFDNNATGEDPAPNLGLFHDVALPPMPASGAAVDEQAFPYICSVPGLISRFSLTNQAHETLVYAALVTPASAYWQSNERVVLPLRERLAVMGAAPFPSICPAPCMIPCSLTNYWAGDMVYHFKFVKTRFHTGRIAIAWAASDSEGGATVVTNKGLTGHLFPPYQHSFSLDRVIIDLRECNEYTFRVPYTNQEGAAAQQGNIGVLCMYIVDPIRAPDTVQPGVQVVVSACMADCQFSEYNGLPFAPTSASASTLFSPQSGIELADVTGEPVETFNTLAKRIAFRTTYRQPFASTLPVYTPNITAPTAVSAVAVDVIDLVRSAYAFERGGMIVCTKETRPSSLTLLPVGATGVNVPRMSFHPEDQAYAHTTVEGETTRAYVPRYAVTPVYKTDHGGINLVDGSGYRETAVVPPAVTTTFTSGYHGRAVADDHQFHFFLGFPPVVRGSLS